MAEFLFGVYTCNRCLARYTVLDTWDRCTPEFCAPCLKHLEAQHALVPVDKDGKETVQ